MSSVTGEIRWFENQQRIVSSMAVEAFLAFEPPPPYPVWNYRTRNGNWCGHPVRMKLFGDYTDGLCRFRATYQWPTPPPPPQSAFTPGANLVTSVSPIANLATVQPIVPAYAHMRVMNTSYANGHNVYTYVWVFWVDLNARPGYESANHLWGCSAGIGIWLKT